MATTTPFPFRNYLSSTSSAPTDVEQLEAFIEWYESALRDQDKAGDMEDHAYYTGLLDAYESVLVALMVVPLKDVSTFYDKGQMPVAPSEGQSQATQT